MFGPEPGGGTFYVSEARGQIVLDIIKLGEVTDIIVGDTDNIGHDGWLPGIDHRRVRRLGYCNPCPGNSGIGRVPHRYIGSHTGVAIVGPRYRHIPVSSIVGKSGAGLKAQRPLLAIIEIEVRLEYPLYCLQRSTPQRNVSHNKFRLCFSGAVLPGVELGSMINILTDCHINRLQESIITIPGVSYGVNIT
ncbi:hypothetical protein ES705_47692 [subsurface metagenome]